MNNKKTYAHPFVQKLANLASARIGRSSDLSKGMVGTLIHKQDLQQTSSSAAWSTKSVQIKPAFTAWGHPLPRP